MSPATARLLFVLELQIRALRARVRLNGVTVFDDSAIERKIVQVKLNSWVVEGRNLVTLELASAAGDKPSLRLSLLRGEHGQEPAPDGRLAAFEREQPGASSITEVWQTEFDARPAFGHWSWQDAPGGPLSESDFSAIRSLVNETATAFRARDAAALAALLAIKNEEVPRALGTDPERYIDAQSAFWNDLFSSPQWTVPPLDLARLRITPQAGGQLASVTTEAGEPPIAGTAGDRRFLMPVMLSRVDGKWRIVR